ncbi:MAG: hypothetical protein V3S08_09240, partial [Phycisphaerales bacterium]
IQHPGTEDQYAVDDLSLQSNSGGVGNDWGYFGCFPNPETGLTAGEAQGEVFELATPPPVSGQQIRITGYGTDSSPPEWNQIQQTHAGPYVSFSVTTLEYRTDTTGGTSGSPVIDDNTGLAIGIHTHGGCTSGGGGANRGTGINLLPLQNALASPQGVCCSTAACPWDLDSSCDVGIVDFLLLLNVWGSMPGGPPDFDGGGVGITDFLELLSNWGPCP